MTGPLDSIIEGATDDAVSTTNLLRKVQVVAHRLQAEDIMNWVQRELNGYDKLEDLPPYRADLVTNVQGVWVAGFGQRMEGLLSAGSIPEEAARALFKLDMFQSVSELETMAASAGESEMGMPWDPKHVGIYNSWIAERIVPHIEGWGVQSANRLVTKALLTGIVDSARNTALGFALDLQAAAPDAGTMGGPTMAQLPVAQVVNNYYETHITGDGNQVAQGKSIRQRSNVAKNDLESLLAAVREFGLDESGRDELVRAVIVGEDRPKRINAFLARVREGAFLIGTGITAEVAATQLADLIAAYLG